LIDIGPFSSFLICAFFFFLFFFFYVEFCLLFCFFFCVFFFLCCGFFFCFSFFTELFFFPLSSLRRTQGNYTPFTYFFVPFSACEDVSPPYGLPVRKHYTFFLVLVLPSFYNFICIALELIKRSASVRTARLLVRQYFSYEVQLRSLLYARHTRRISFFFIPRPMYALSVRQTDPLFSSESCNYPQE